MHIDQATPSDIPTLSDLLSLLFAQEEEFAPNPEAQARGLRRIVDDPAVGAVLVARDADRIVGMVTLLFTVSTALGERVAWLEDMVVSPQARGAGVGAQLLAGAISFARSAGCRRITLLTDGSNESAQRFYARQGFAQSGMVPMRLLLT
ncbi:MAG: GNAT family N-acetyltransferase [Ectothiorhodospiraceae bacterium]|jgi:GNAT superfamily N-acetyltransferase|nr:GNAT family N-acetyltransferase [Ectothiorhodospiraceae bacterium]